MFDYFDDFNDVGENGFMDDDSFEDCLEGEMDEPFSDDNEPDDEPIEAESKDDDLTADPFVVGGLMGFAYEEGLRARKRRKPKKFSDDSD
jgi:hypothetical protein